jgi:hypothetical protein
MRRSQPCVNSPSSVGMGPMRELEFRLLRNHHPPSAPGLLLGGGPVRSQCNTYKEETAVKRPSSVGMVPVTELDVIDLRDREPPPRLSHHLLGWRAQHPPWVNNARRAVAVRTGPREP